MKYEVRGLNSEKSGKLQISAEFSFVFDPWSLLLAPLVLLSVVTR